MNDYIAGLGVGLNQVIIGHPFDTLKILIQNNKKYTISFTNMYRGWQPPFFNSILYNSIIFSLYGKINNYVNNSFYSGILIGSILSPVMFITDSYKIRYQLNNNKNFKFKDVIYNYGKISSLTKDSLQIGLYFGFYNLFNEYFNNILISGALSGALTNTFLYPLDFIKNNQIAKNISFKEVINLNFRFNGYSLMIIRSIILGSTNFYIYEKLKNYN